MLIERFSSRGHERDAHLLVRRRPAIGRRLLESPTTGRRRVQGAILCPLPAISRSRSSTVYAGGRRCASTASASAVGSTPATRHARPAARRLTASCRQSAL